MSHSETTAAMPGPLGTRSQTCFTRDRIPEGPWLAGVRTSETIYYVCVDSRPQNPGWTPYAAMAERWSSRKDAELAARNAAKVFNISGRPCLQDEKQPFRGSGLECEILSEKTP